MFKKYSEEYEEDNCSITPINEVQSYEGFEVGEVVLYSNTVCKIERIDLNSGIYLIRQDTLQRIQILSIYELTKCKAGKVLF